MDFRLRQIINEFMRKPAHQNKHIFSDGKTRPPKSPADRNALDEFVIQEQRVRLQRIKWERTKQRAYYCIVAAVFVAFLLAMIFAR